MDDHERQALPPPDEPDLGRRLATCLSSSRLFSLDLGDVLQETAALMAEVLPGVDVSVLAFDQPSRAGNVRLDDRTTALIDDARATRATALDEAGRIIAVPLCVRHQQSSEPSRAAVGTRVVGVALLEAGTPLSPASLSLAELLADRAAVAVEHATMYQTQAQIAQQLQRRLLPVESPRIDGLEIGVLFRSRTEGALIGGDFVDFVTLSPHQIAVSIGDVSGKGVAAAAFTVITKYALRAILATLSWPTWPGEALRDLHNALQGQLDPDGYVTVALGLIDASRGTLSLASAGHPSPFLLRDGAARQPLIITAPAIALADQSELEPFPTERIELQTGDTLLFYTDGLSELRNAEGEFYDERCLATSLADFGSMKPQQLVEALYLDAVNFSVRPPHDDVALVALRLAG